MNQPTFEDWQARAAVLRVEGRAFIDGEARHAHTGATFACVSPIDGGVLAHVADCGTDDVDLAVMSVAESVYGPGRDALLAADLSGIPREHDFDPSRPPSEPAR